VSYQVTVTKENVPTKKLIVELLRKNGPSDYSFLSYELALSLVNTKKHCYRLNLEKVVDIVNQPGTKSLVKLTEQNGAANG
jgi:predicted ArsR family transcriptional regulator